LTGLKIVKAADGQVLGGGMGIVRQIAHFVDAIICLIGYLFPLWDPQRQTIADKLLGTVVLMDQPKEEFSAELFKL
ncbi:MAG: RDD family protein, partial [Acidimicrobiia bacterium]|nr:RDD family protein [Acidimicrobiia bacterium]